MFFLAYIIMPILIVNVLLGGFATKYIVEFWMFYVKGITPHISFFFYEAAGLLLGQITIPAAILTWLFSLIS